MNHSLKEILRQSFTALLVVSLLCLAPSARAQKVKVACVGNSITYGSGIQDRLRDGYPAQLQRLMGEGFDVRNFGHGGKCAQDDSDAPYTDTQEYRDALAFLPDIVIIKLGTNDTKPQNWHGGKRFEKGVERIALSFSRLTSKPRIMIAFPAKAYQVRWGINDSIIVHGVIPSLWHLAAKHHWQVIDLHRATEGMSGDFPDGIHPNVRGAGVLAYAVRDAIREDPNRPQVLFHTDEGDIRVELFNETPRHRDNFLRQVKDGTYNGVLWHRVISQFLIQTGDRLSKNAREGELLGEGNESPSDWIPAEFREPMFFHQRGMLNAAREGDDTNPEQKSSSTQFTIITGRKMDDATLDRAQTRVDEWTHGRTKLTPEMRDTYKAVGGAPHLDGSYTVFGRVVSGMDVVENIEKAATDGNDRPLRDIRIRKAVIIKK